MKLLRLGTPKQLYGRPRGVKQNNVAYPKQQDEEETPPNRNHIHLITNKR